MTHERSFRTRGVLNLRGCCPLCGAEVHRRVTRAHDSVNEVYHCPIDGDVRYSTGARTTMETSYGLTESPPWWPRPMPAPTQAVTGIALVA